ncbi:MULTISPECIES: phage tail assembly chaperone [unclassified Rhizobium]
MRAKDCRTRYSLCRGRRKKLRQAFRSYVRNATDPGLDEWEAELAKAYPDQKWLRREPPFTPHPWHAFFFAAFELLTHDRRISDMGGEGPIYYQAISQYARDYGIAGDDYRRFLIFIKAIDAEHLMMARERSQPETITSNGNGHPADENAAHRR